MLPEEKELINRIEAIEKRLKEIDTMLELLEHVKTKTIMNMLDGPIMMYGKHNINKNDINDKDNEIEDIIKKAE